MTGSVILFPFDVDSGAMTKLPRAIKVFQTWKPKRGTVVAAISDPQSPTELYSVEKNSLHKLTHVQDSFLAPLQLATAEGFQSKSKDGTLVSGILYRPANTAAGKKLPLILFIHGGPVGRMNLVLI
jgi:dipeptidyl aminopeptidase/acylaminoacyl peptidase